MGTEFFFQFGEEDLRKALARMDEIRQTNPDIKLNLRVSVDLIPDGMGYECSDPKIEIVEEGSERDATTTA